MIRRFGRRADRKRGRFGGTHGLAITGVIYTRAATYKEGSGLQGVFRLSPRMVDKPYMGARDSGRPFSFAPGTAIIFIAENRPYLSISDLLIITLR